MKTEIMNNEKYTLVIHSLVQIICGCRT